MDCSRAKTRDPDEWLDAAPDFSRPICSELREQFQRWEPDLSESIKWNILCFSGRKLVAGLSACKAHVSIAFFRGTELPDPTGLFSDGETNTNIRSIRITNPVHLRLDALRVLLHAAVNLDADVEIRPAPKVKREPIPLPEILATALRRDRRSAEGFARLSASCQREYIIWLTTAKRPETQARRLAETLAAVRHGRKWMDRKG